MTDGFGEFDAVSNELRGCSRGAMSKDGQRIHRERFQKR